MRTKKLGFSLVELLVTVGIIGIVAAIIVPSLKDRATTKMFVPKSERIAANIQASMMNVLEVATRNANSDASTGVSDRLSDLVGNDFFGTEYGSLSSGRPDMMLQNMYTRMQLGNNRNFFRSISSVIGLTGLTADEQLEYRGKDIAEENLSNGFLYFKSKRDGAYVIIELASNVGENILNDDSIALTRIMIDVNGNRPPNTLYNAEDNPKGDIFLYGLGNNGTMYKEGSKMYENHTWELFGGRLGVNPDNRFFQK